MRFEWFIAIRYLRAARAQTALILAAVSVGVSVIVFLSALIDGLQASLIEQTLGSQPHVTLRPPEEAARPLDDGDAAVARTIEKTTQRLKSIDEWPKALATTSAVPGVIAVSPTVTGAGFAERGNAKRPIVVRGIDPERFLAIIDIRARTKLGSFDVSGANVVIGKDLADDLGATVGDKIRVTTTEGLGDVETITGVFDLGNKGVNETWILTSLRHAQSLYALPGGATTIELKVADVFEAERIARELADRSGLRADSWMTLNAQLLVGLRSQNSSKYMIQFFVVVAVTLGIASVLIVSVVQKSQEIGILRAFGTPARRVLLVFLVQGGLLGLAGSALGCALGALLSLGFERLAENPDGSPTFPVALGARLFVGATVLAVAIGVGAALLPARRAARLDPADAIRHV